MHIELYKYKGKVKMGHQVRKLDRQRQETSCFEIHARRRTHHDVGCVLSVPVYKEEVHEPKVVLYGATSKPAKKTDSLHFAPFTSNLE